MNSPQYGTRSPESNAEPYECLANAIPHDHVHHTSNEFDLSDNAVPNIHLDLYVPCFIRTVVASVKDQAISRLTCSYATRKNAFKNIDGKEGHMLVSITFFLLFHGAVLPSKVKFLNLSHIYN